MLVIGILCTFVLLAPRLGLVQTAIAIVSRGRSVETSYDTSDGDDENDMLLHRPAE